MIAAEWREAAAAHAGGAKRPSRCPRRRPFARSRARGTRLRPPTAPVIRPAGAGFAQLDPFNAVRTPERNFGPARIGSVAVTPLARRLAGERGIDLATRHRLRPAWPHRRPRRRGAVAGRRCRRPRPGRRRRRWPALYRDVPFEEVAARRHARDHRRASDVEAKQTVPHFYLTADVTMDALLAIARARSMPRRRGPWRSGLQAVGQRLRHQGAGARARCGCRRPMRCWAGDRILRFTEADIGVAVALDGGLLDAGDPRRRAQVAERHLR